MKRRTELTLKDIAILLDGDEIPDATAARFAPFLRKDPRLKAEIAELELMAQDAGMAPDEPERFRNAYDNDQDFRQLLAAKSWDQPEEIFDPDVCISLGELLAIAAARMARSPNPLLAEVQEKLERAAAEKRAVEQLVDAFLTGLQRLPTQQAEALIAEAGRRYRDRQIAQGEP